MSRIKERYDVVIIGSGLGGLLCGNFLALEGKQVCILEKNAQIGGNLQTFKRDGVKFDSGVHYIGGLEEGQALFPFFRFFGLMDSVEKTKLDTDAFDVITFSGDENRYPHAQGYENFVQQLLKFFPQEEKGLRRYCEEIQTICSKFEWYNLDKRLENPDELSTFSISAKEVIDSCTDNPILRKVLAGSNMLYAGAGDSSPFYVHALITDSYIGSAYKLKHSDQIAKKLRKNIKVLGGEVHINTEVIKIENDAQKVLAVELASGQKVEAELFISNIHPSLTFQMLNPEGIRKVTLNRMLGLRNTLSTFILYIKLKPGTFPYSESNHYHFFDSNVWELQDYTSDHWVKGIALFNSPDEAHPNYAKSLTAMAYMRHDEVAQWEKTLNTTLSEDTRGQSYLDFKEQKARELISYLEKIHPEIRDQIESYHTATPLTQRDYIGSVEGGIYGIKRDFNSPHASFISPKTKLSNLYLTGQNVILHGVLGVSIGAAVTCQEILGKAYVMEKFRKYC